MASSPLARLLQQIDRLLHAGDPAAAQAACEQALRKAPRHPDVLLLAGVTRLALGDADNAVPFFERILAADPRNGAALEHLGLAQLMLGRFVAAEHSLANAAALAAAPASVHMRLGVARLEQGRAGEAVAPLQRATAMAPHDPDAHLNLGRALAATGRSAEARGAFEAALRLSPRHPDPPHNLGVLELRNGNLAEAQRWFEHALALDARNAEVSSALAHTYALQARFETAREQYRRSLVLAPQLASAHEGLASVCIALGRLSEAIEHLQETLRLEADNLAAAAALANTLFQAGRLEEAGAAARRCLELDPGSAAAYGVVANVELVHGELDAAVSTLETGYARTRDGALLGMLAYQLRQTCDWERWRAAWEEAASMLRSGRPLGSPFWLLCEPTRPDEQLQYTRGWAETRFGPALPRPARPEPGPAPRRYRIGYLSSDLHEHATAYLIAEVMERHDRDRFEVFAYSHGPNERSAMRQRLQSAFEHFVDIANDPDDVAAARIRGDALDLLIDLKGYTLGDRLTIMARRPCALQASWLGYPGTTASSFIDYLIADPVIVPAAAEPHYSERIARLPHCYQPNDRARAVAVPLTRSDYGLPAEGWVFCCFNQTYKITPDLFAVWMRLLRTVNDSVLWLFESNARAVANLSRAADAHGVDARRIVFAPRLPNAQHLARYRVADIALDTFPYTSHTTMSDALWCGCPAVALLGETFAARVSSSIVTAAGLPELVARTLEDYEALVLRLVREPGFLQDVRMRVVRARTESPLFDSEKFTRDLEALYMRMISERVA